MRAYVRVCDCVYACVCVEWRIYGGGGGGVLVYISIFIFLTVLLLSRRYNAHNENQGSYKCSLQY